MGAKYTLIFVVCECVLFSFLIYHPYKYIDENLPPSTNDGFLCLLETKASPLGLTFPKVRKIDIFNKQMFSLVRTVYTVRRTKVNILAMNKLDFQTKPQSLHVPFTACLVATIWADSVCAEEHARNVFIFIKLEEWNRNLPLNAVRKIIPSLQAYSILVSSRRKSRKR